MRDREWLRERAILAPTNEIVGQINEKNMSHVDGDIVEYLYVYNIMDIEQVTLYPVEFLNSLEMSGVPSRLSSRAFIIATERDITGKDATTSDGTPLCRESSVIEILSLYPWETIKLTVFKRSQKQALKASFINDGVRYFEMREIPKKKIFWSLWCSSINELQCSDKKWPFSLSTQLNNRRQEIRVAECIELRFIKRAEKEKRLKWTDKYLYLGSTREEEDKVRPVPVPGLGRAEEINLYYLKPRYFGCWEQTEHWVQVGDSSLNALITENE